MIFLELRPNCPLIASTNISNGGVAKLFICRDYTMNNVTLMASSSFVHFTLFLFFENPIFVLD